MGADFFHYHAHRCLQRKCEVYDIKDFSDSVKDVSHKIKVNSMEIGEFYDWQYKLNKIMAHPYLNYMVEDVFSRGKQILVIHQCVQISILYKKWN